MVKNKVKNDLKTLPKLSLIIPCYNEEEGIANLHSQLIPVICDLKKDYLIELIFIDDGSSDRTFNLLRHYFAEINQIIPKLKIIRHKKNRNLGAAIRTGFAHSTGDILVTLDSDCTYLPAEIRPMLKLLDKDTSIVTASPYHPKGGVKNVSKYRLFLSKSITLIYRLITGAKIHTFTALFRAQKKEIVQNIHFNSNDFLATAEILIKAHRRGYKIKEYPTILHVRTLGVSKMRLLKVIYSHLKFITKII